ncbi:YlxR family protein [Plantactinospora mayteni]|uniref:YlxR family protein n=1 Tax=Plantactinospora mayteni TaxID=566021 RepID=UPI001942DB0F|nr:YlxR family protein [Plantactinospora mayteni]
MVRRAEPERTCVGCRQRAPAGQLLRIVAVGDETGHSLRPDPTRKLPGRGAHLHPDPACFTLAVRRRAFGRALRIAGVPDASELAEHLQGVDDHDRPAGRAGSTQRNPSKVGRPT